MSEMSAYDVGRQDKKPKMDVRYTRAKIYRRVFSRLIDLTLFVLVGLLLFFGTREIIRTMPFYRQAEQEVLRVMVNSGIYVEVDDGYQDVVTYYTNDVSLSTSQKKERYEETIDTFLAFAKEEAKEEDYQEAKDNYDKERLDFVYDGTHMFILSESGEVIDNPDFIAKESSPYELYSQEFYIPYIDNVLRGYLLSLFPSYYQGSRLMSNMVLFAELPIAVILSCFLVYFLPPLIFKRGRKTIGMLAYRIGRIDSHLLNVPLKQYLIYSAIFDLGIICLSFLTLGIPLLVSVTMMAVTKGHQDFPEYMLQINEVDVTSSKIYFSLEELEVDYEKTQKKPIEFKNTTFEDGK